MCNTKNTETIRQQLWCDTYIGYIKDMSHLESTKGANCAVEEFDKTFNDKLDYQGPIGGISIDDVHSQLKEFFKDEYYEVTTFDDKSKGVSCFAGIAKDGKHKTIKIYENHFKKKVTKNN